MKELNESHSKEDSSEDLEDESLAEKDDEDLHQGGDESDSFVIGDSYEERNDENLNQSLADYHSPQLSSDETVCQERKATTRAMTRTKSSLNKLKAEKESASLKPSPHALGSQGDGKQSIERK